MSGYEAPVYPILRAGAAKMEKAARGADSLFAVGYTPLPITIHTAQRTDEFKLHLSQAMLDLVVCPLSLLCFRLCLPGRVNGMNKALDVLANEFAWQIVDAGRKPQHVRRKKPLTRCLIPHIEKISQRHF